MKTHATLSTRVRAAPRRWLVTGAAGFIGSHLVETLLALDQQVAGMDNFATGSRANLAQVKEAVTDAQWGRFDFIEGDIRSRDACARACRGADLVLHQAALGSVPRSLEDPTSSTEVNVCGFTNVLDAARHAGASRVVYASSSAVYGDEPALPKGEARIGRPLSPYALTKLVNEQYAEVFARCYGTATIGLRYFNVFGPRQDPNGAYAAVIPRWIVALIRGAEVTINGDGSTTRDFCYIDNVVQANLLAALEDDPAAANQVYNVARNDMVSLNELYEILRGLLEPIYPQLRGARPVYGEPRQGDVRFSRADIAKAERLLGYSPQWDVRRGLAQTVQWYLVRMGGATGRGVSKTAATMG